MTLLDTIQTLVMQVLNGAQLTDIKAGTVTSADPLEITLDTAQAPLREEVLILTQEVKDFAEVNGKRCCVWGNPFVINDKLLLLSVQHGQKFIVLSRL